MRLQAVEPGHRLKERIILVLVRRTLGDAPDIMRTLFHRPEFLGRELFAAYVSTQNRCEFCVVFHPEYACQAGDRQQVEQTLRDGAAGDPRLDAAL